MKIIVETDIGRDADDLFSLIWLYENCLDDIACVTITPGHPDQIAIVKALNKFYKRNIDIGASKYDKEKRSSNPFHKEIIKILGSDDFLSEPNDVGYEVINKNFKSFFHSYDFIVLGPLTNIGNFIKLYNPNLELCNATMQGGFLPCENEKFKGLESCPTFNLNGDRKAAEIFLNANFFSRNMVGKNVGHFKFIFDRSKLELFNTCSLMFKAFQTFLKYNDSKKLQDPLATLLSMYPEHGDWVRGKTVKAKSGWTTVEGNDFILKDLKEEEKLWEKLALRTFSI